MSECTKILRRWRGGAVTDGALKAFGALATCAVIALILATSATAANEVTLQIKDAPLKEVVLLLTQQSGTNIVIADDASLDTKVTASLNDVPLEKALSYVVKSAGVSYRKMPDGTYIIGGEDGEQSVEAAKDLPSSLTPIEPVAPVSAPAEIIVTKISLTHSRPSDIIKLMTEDAINGSYQTPGDSFPNMRRNNNSNNNNSANTSPGQGAQGGVFLRQSGGQTLDVTNGVRLQNNQPVIPTIDPTAMNTGSGRTADLNTGAAQYPATGARSGYNPNNPGTSGSTSNTSNANNKNQNFLWPDGVKNAVPFDMDNSILVKGDEDGIEKFKKIVRMLDVPPKQVRSRRSLSRSTPTKSRTSESTGAWRRSMRLSTRRSARPAM